MRCALPAKTRRFPFKADTQVATVTDDGVVVGMKPGVATITLTAEDGSSCEWTITVTDSGSIWH